MPPPKKRARNEDPNTLDTHCAVLTDSNSPLPVISGAISQHVIKNECHDVAITDTSHDESSASVRSPSSTPGMQMGGGDVSDRMGNPDYDLDSVTVDRLVREGGVVGDYRVVARPHFNSLVIHRTLNFRGSPDTDMASYICHLYSSLNDIVDFSRTLGGENGVFNITLRLDSLTTDVNVILTPANDYALDHLIEAIENVLQGNADLLTDESLELTISIVRARQGGAYRKLRDLAHDEVIRKKRMNLFCPENVSNNTCFAICLAHYLNPGATADRLVMLGSDIHRRAGFTPQQKIGFGDVVKFESLCDVKIVVFYRAGNGTLLKYQSSETPHPKTAFLYLHDDHFYGVIKPNAFLGASYFCNSCHSAYNNKRDHACNFSCDVCNGPECYKKKGTPVYCEDCGRYCKSDYCHFTHKQHMPTKGSGLVAPCDVTKHCKKCNKRYHVSMNDPKPHQCSAKRCPHCSVELLPGVEHSCFIQPIKPRKIESKYIFFNLETRFENGKHQANFAYAMTHSGMSFAAEGDDCVDRLLHNFRRSKYTGYTWLAHKAAGFDNIILLEHFSKMGITPKITMMGCRLIFMYDEIFKQRFIDSHSFIPMCLAKTTAALNLKTSERGYFPHRFNTSENNNYCGFYPDRVYYGYDAMSDEERATFDEWYDENSKNEFNFQKELHTYGRNCVILLREACMKYHEEFIDCTGLDPFSLTTLASCCMAVYKTHYLPPDTLALTHNKAYVKKRKAYSNISIEWLELVKAIRKVDVQHALNSGEVQVKNYHLNGYYEKDGIKHALEFNGCFHYGHNCRYNLNQLHPLSKTPYRVLRQHFDDKVAYLTKTEGFKVEIMWECQWKQAKQSDPVVMDFMETYIHPERLKPHESLFGGRTETYKLYYKAKQGERIRYIDFTSLYPACQSMSEYPTHNPQIILKDFEPLENYFGLIKATVTPPRQLLYPVLPYHCNGKLMFPLCRTCAEEENQTDICSHNDEERTLSGCWVSLELMKAIEKGYVVTRVEEVWHFPQRSDTLFSNYVKTFQQHMQEASGYPTHVVTEDEKRAYIEDYFEKEGIRLNPDKICVNQARQSISKLLLNSLWNQFSMSESPPTTVMLKDPEQFTKYIFGCEYDITHFSFVSDDVALLQCRHTKGACVQTPDRNVFVEAFTAAHARLKLYDLMDNLGERLLYSDTDSVIFVSKDGDWEPPLGPYLGDLTDKLGDGDYITEFCSGGPKTYGYRTATGKTCMKAKGITQNAENSKVIRLDTLLDLVDHPIADRDRARARHSPAHTENIVLNKKHLTLKNKSDVKRFKIVYNKRVLLPDYSTKPYGY